MSTLTENIAKQFCDSSGDADLGEYTDITSEAAAILSTCEGRLNLSGLTALSAEAAEALAKHGGI